MNIDSQYYIKQFMTTYLKNTYIPQSTIIYLVYNTITKQFKTTSSIKSNTPFEYYFEIFSNEEEFNIFVAYSIIDDNHYIELTTLDSAEQRIYEYYDYYNIEKDEIDIFQKYTSEIIGNTIYNIISTTYHITSEKKELDYFIVYHFSLTN